MINHRAEVDNTVVLGAETVVYQFATVCECTAFGARCVIGAGAWVGSNVVAGNDVRLQSNVFIPNGTQIGNRVFIGPCAVLADDAHPRVNNKFYKAEPPVIEHDANIGAGAVVLPGIRIGHGSTVGAGAVVTKDVPPGVTVIGVPARPMTTSHEVGVSHNSRGENNGTD